MEKKNLDWANIGFEYVQKIRDMLQIIKTENGMRERLQRMLTL